MLQRACTAHRHVRVLEKRVFTVCKPVRRHGIESMHCAQACQVACKERMHRLQQCQEAWYSEHAQFASMSGGMIQRACKARMHRLPACQDAWYSEHAKRACTVCKHVRSHATVKCTAHRHVRVHAKRVFTICKHVRRHGIESMPYAQACQGANNSAHAPPPFRKVNVRRGRRTIIF